jgi:hypothetical protein
VTEPDDETLFHDDFICTCGADRRAARDALVAEVMRRLPEDENYSPPTVTAERFVSDVIGALSANYRVSIDHIAYDQWFLIVADRWEVVPGELRVRSALRVRMQCDDVEGGLAAIWRFFADGDEPVERRPFAND